MCHLKCDIVWWKSLLIKTSNYNGDCAIDAAKRNKAKDKTSRPSKRRFKCCDKGVWESLETAPSGLFRSNFCEY